MRLPAMFVCLSVCLLARLLKNVCMDLDEILRDPDISPDAGTGKSESQFEIGQTGTLLRAGYRSRDALQRDTVYLLHVVVQGPGRFTGPIDFSVRRRPTVADCRATERQSCPIFWFWPIFPIQNP